MKPLKLTFVVALALATTATAQRKMRTTDFTSDTLMVHDPVMAYCHDTYHVFSTGRGIQHATSKDMKTWTLHVEPTLSLIPKWAHDSVPGFRDHVWAPDIIKYRDRWWIAYSCSTFGKNTSAIGLMSTRDLTPGAIWNDEGPLVCSRERRDNWNAIDANFVIDDNDRPWLVFGSFWDGIQIVPLDSTMHISNPKEQKTIARRYPGKKENPVEAPFIFKHGGYYYLFVSWDYCCRGAQSNYRVAVGRSRSVEGPYLDREGKDMAQGGGTLFLEGDKKEWEAAGHCAAYTFDGQDVFVCHGYSAKQNGAALLIQRPISWTADGWPELRP